MSGLIVEQLRKTFASGDERLEVLRGVGFHLERGESLAITGPSGSGKSTLLHILGTLEHPTSGRVEIDGRDPFSLPPGELARFRNQKVGFVFQDHHLFAQLTSLENVLLPTLVRRGSCEGVEDHARALLERVGLGERMDHRPAELSGGERQRVAVARALVQKPPLVLCDEPTGSLDAASGEVVRDLLLELHREMRSILIVVTHSEELAGCLQRRARLRAGSMQE